MPAAPSPARTPQRRRAKRPTAITASTLKKPMLTATSHPGVGVATLGSRAVPITNSTYQVAASITAVSVEIRSWSHDRVSVISGTAIGSAARSLVAII